MRILHLEDSGPDAELVAEKLAGAWPDCRVSRAASREQYLAALDTGEFDLILSDYTLTGFDGLSALKLARVHCPATPFIFLSGTIGEERAIEALKSGASDYVIKDRPSRLVPAIRRSLERAQEERRLRRAEERIRQQAELLDRAQDAILMRDLDDRITYWNQGAARIYGWTASEAQGRVTADLWEEDPAQTEIARQQTLASGEWMGEMSQRARSGADLLMQSRWSLVRGKKREPAGFLVINTDVAEKKRLEAQFLRVQRVESIGLLAGGVAHDINNVLVPILVSSELLEPMVTDPDGRQFLASIRSSAQHGAALVKQLLGFARGVIGPQEELALAPLLSDFVDFVAQTLPKSIQFTLETAPEIWPVRGDATQLKQVLLNLCLNARDAMPDGGRIVIRLANLTLDETAAAALHEVEPGPHVVLSVIDTGAGMSPAVQKKIFDPFFTTKELGKGTGLGLAAVRGIVKGHHGAVAVESAPGKGAAFRIYLPAAARAGDGLTSPPATGAARGAGQGILLVDDEAWVRDILGSLLAASGYRVFKAGSGNEALALLTARPAEIALVLTDMMMPNGDGLTLVQEIRGRDRELPIVAMSGMAGSGRFDEPLRRCNVPLLAKPIMRDTLLDAVQTALVSRGAT